MATRIKRYEERIDRLDELLERIEAEMGPHAELERREFKRGGFLGIFGGTPMVEVVATIEVGTEGMVPVSQGIHDTAAQAPAETGAAEHSAPAPEPAEIDDTLADLIPRSRYHVDVEASDPVSDLLKEAVDQEPADPEPAIETPQEKLELVDAVEDFNQGSATRPLRDSDPIIPRAAPPNQDLEELENRIAQVEDVVTSASNDEEKKKEINDLRDSIDDLKDTVRMLIEAQYNALHAQAKQHEVEQATAGLVAGTGIVKPPKAEPEKPPAPTGPVLPISSAAARLDNRFLTESHEAYEKLLDWNIGPYDAVDLVNEALADVEEGTTPSLDSLIKTISSNICKNILLSNGIKLKSGPPGKVVALVGATGVGKTTSIAKLAAQYAFQHGKRVSLVSLDNYRIAAAEQLRTYSDIMGIDLDIVFSREEFDEVLTQRKHSDLVLVDTAGRSPMVSKRITELREVFQAHPPDEVHLVISASTKGDDLRVITESFKQLSYDHIIVSKLDETCSLGVIYNINKLCQVPISYFTIGQSVPEDIRTANLDFIQEWIEQGQVL